MKNIILSIILILGFGITVKAQMAIGKHDVEGSGIVDFGSGGVSGMVLPWVTKIPVENDLTPGMMIYNAIQKKVMYYNGTIWVDLSLRAGTVDLSEQNTINEVATQGTVLGALSSPVKGVLVLETSNKALILPKVASPHLNIVKPMAGTICYDVTKKMVCIYNGSEWSFWE